MRRNKSGCTIISIDGWEEVCFHGVDFRLELDGLGRKQPCRYTWFNELSRATLHKVRIDTIERTNINPVIFVFMSRAWIANMNS